MDSRTLARYRTAWLTGYATAAERADILDKWCRWCDARRVDPIRPTLQAAAEWSTHLRDASHELTGRPIASGTRRKYISTIRSFLKFCGDAATDAFEQLDNPPRGGRRRRPIDEDVHLRMMRAAALEYPGNRSAMRCLLGLMRDGVPLKVAVSLPLDAFDPESATLNAPAVLRPRYARSWELSTATLAALGAYLRTRSDSGPLIVNAKGTAMPSTQAYTAFNRIASRAGVGRIAPADYARADSEPARV